MIEQTDDFVKDEPLAFLVKRFGQDGDEFETFVNVYQAAGFAKAENQKARDAGEECDCEIYPLYASHPKSINEAVKKWC